MMVSLPSRTLTDDDIAIVKFLIKEGIHHDDIATLMQCNVGRISEVNTGARGPDVKAAKMGPGLRQRVAELFGRMSIRHARLFGGYLPPAD